MAAGRRERRSTTASESTWWRSLPPTGVHILRHTAAKLRLDAGESIESVSQFLDHSSLAVTMVYLRRLEGQADEGWVKAAEGIGL